MAVNDVHVPYLAEVMKSYYNHKERELYDLLITFDMELSAYCSGSSISYTKLARDLIKEASCFELLKSLVGTFMSWSKAGINRFYSHESVEYYESIMYNLGKLESEIQMNLIESGIHTPEQKPFLAKSKVRDLLGKAETMVVVIDNYIGMGTLDCLRDVSQPILIITGDKSNSIKAEFDTALIDFRKDGHSVEIRRHEWLHDRYISFNDRCWIVGSSLKDAGSKSFNIVEIVDARSQVLNNIKTKIRESKLYS